MPKKSLPFTRVVVMVTLYQHRFSGFEKVTDNHGHVFGNLKNLKRVFKMRV